MYILLGILFSALFIVGGSLMVYGTWHSWSLLVDPPEEFWLTYSQSFMKKVLGTDALRMHNYILGSVLVLVGLIILWNGFLRGR